MFRVTGPGVELKPFSGRTVGFLARESDQGTVRIGLACNSTVPEVNRDIVLNVLPAAYRAVSLSYRGSKRGSGRGRRGRGGGRPLARHAVSTSRRMASLFVSAPQPASSSEGMLASHAA
jgi:hypothetical protein